MPLEKKPLRGQATPGMTTTDTLWVPSLCSLAKTAFLFSSLDVLDDLLLCFEPGEIERSTREYLLLRSKKTADRAVLVSCGMDSLPYCISRCFLAWLGGSVTEQGDLLDVPGFQKFPGLCSLRECYHELLAFGNFLESSCPELVAERRRLDTEQKQLSEEWSNFWRRSEHVCPCSLEQLRSLRIEISEADIIEKKELELLEKRLRAKQDNMNAKTEDNEKDAVNAVRSEKHRTGWKTTQQASPFLEEVGLFMASNFENGFVKLAFSFIPSLLPYKVKNVYDDHGSFLSESVVF